MNSIPDIITRRRSVFPPSFTGERIAEEKIDALTEAANRAPTHKFTEPWRFKIFADAGKIRFFDYVISRLQQDGDTGTKVRKMELFKTKVSHVMTIVMKRHEAAEIPEVEEVCAVACAVQNMYLCTAALEIAGYWSTGMYCFDDDMRRFLNLATDEKCLGFFVLGIPDATLAIPPSRRRPASDKITKLYS